MENIILERYINEILEKNIVKDYGEQGLQVHGKKNIKKIASAVSCNMHTLELAVELGVDALLVHHGILWKNQSSIIKGVAKNRLAFILSNNLNIFAYHLCLDVHPLYGNNVQLGHKLNLNAEQCIFVPGVGLIGACSNLEPGVQAVDFKRKLDNILGRVSHHISSSKNIIKKICWITGAGYDYLEQAVEETGCDAFVTGEIAERTYHIARELDIDYFVAGHYATEKFGVVNLGEHISSKFNVEHVFIDDPNPI